MAHRSCNGHTFREMTELWGPWLAAGTAPSPGAPGTAPPAPALTRALAGPRQRPCHPPALAITRLRTNWVVPSHRRVMQLAVPDASARPSFRPGMRKKMKLFLLSWRIIHFIIGDAPLVPVLLPVWEIQEAVGGGTRRKQLSPHTSR